MKWLRAALVLLAVLAGCGGHGADRFEGEAADVEATYGSCAFCHKDKGVRMLPAGGEPKCEVCHENQQPGMAGPGHRALPGPDEVPSFVGPSHDPGAEAALGSCVFCHNQFAKHVFPYSADLTCEVCHEDRLPGRYGPGHRVIPGPELVPAFAGPTHRLGGEGIFGYCAYCHNNLAGSVLQSMAGDLTCPVCHQEALSGDFGPGHRSIPGPELVPSFVGPAHDSGAEAAVGSCAFCHNQFAQHLSPYSADLTCEVCHADRRPGLYGPGHRVIPGPDLVPAFAGPTHRLGAEAVFGYCAYCHNGLAGNILESGVEDLTCTFCHLESLSADFGPGHRIIPGPERVPSFPGPMHLLGDEARFGRCAFCHNAVTVGATTYRHGPLSVECERCHVELRSGEVGPEHQSVPACGDCHDEQRTHQDPAAGTRSECTVCHTPHGSPNLYLIRERILTPGGPLRDVTFDNLDGLADGSFASVSQPGTGVCEICHRGTSYYRGDGSGAPHFPYPCLACHLHAEGFAPP